MELDLIPEQPAPVVDAVAALLGETDARAPAVDPWWQAGVDENLEP